MSLSVVSVAEGFATRLATITGLRAYAYQPEQLNPPFAFPVLTNLGYHKSMGMGSAISEMAWTVTVITGRWVDRVSYQRLDAYMSPTGASSVRAAIEADTTLGGSCSDLIVNSSANISALEQDDADFLQVSFSVTVYGQ